MAFTEPIELFFAFSEWTHNGYPATTTTVSFLPSLNATCGEREGGTGAGGLITHYCCDILWWSAAATCHPFDYPNGKTTTCRRRAGGHPSFVPLTMDTFAGPDF